MLIFLDAAGGQSDLALRLLLAVFSSKISSGANRPFGEEVIPQAIVACKFYSETLSTGAEFCCCVFCQFRAARKVSEDIGAQLVLGDRPIEITVCIWLSVQCFLPGLQ